MIYTINFDRWKRQILPPALASKQRLNDLLLAALDGVSGLHTKFLLYREATLYKLRWTSQTIYLEKLLNDRFNNGNPAFQNFELRQTPVGIYIDEPASYVESIYRWNKIENRRDGYRFNKSELASMAVNDSRRRRRYNRSELQANNDFVVKVPTGLFDVTNVANTALLANMRAWIELYRIAGTRYIIENY